MAIGKNGQTAIGRFSRVQIGDKMFDGTTARLTPSRFRRTPKHWPLPAAHRAQRSRHAVRPRNRQNSGIFTWAIATRSTASSPDGNQPATVVRPHHPADPASGELRTPRDTTVPFTASFSPDGASPVPAATHPSNLEHPNGQRLDTSGQPTGEQFLTAFTPDNQFVIAGGADKQIRLWRWVSGTRRGSIHSSGYGLRTRMRLPISRSTAGTRARPRLPLIGRPPGRSLHRAATDDRATGRGFGVGVQRGWASCTSAEWTARPKIASAWPSAQILWPRRTPRPAVEQAAEPIELAVAN